MKNRNLTGIDRGGRNSKKCYELGFSCLLEIWKKALSGGRVLDQRSESALVKSKEYECEPKNDRSFFRVIGKLYRMIIIDNEINNE